MRALLLALVLLLIAPEALAVNRWAGERVVVSDFSGWPEVSQAVEQMNALLPKKAPRFIYRVMPETPCEDVPRRKGITVCAAPTLLFDGEGNIIVGTTRGHDRHPIERVTIQLSEQTQRADRLWDVCHELFHATTGVGNHGSWVDVRPCPFDEVAARRVYKKAHR